MRADTQARRDFLAEKQRAVIAAIRGGHRSLKMIRACAGLTDREADRVLQSLRRQGAIEFGRVSNQWRVIA